jgi:hypothetical protein
VSVIRRYVDVYYRPAAAKVGSLSRMVSNNLARALQKKNSVVTISIENDDEQDDDYTIGWKHNSTMVPFLHVREITKKSFSGVDGNSTATPGRLPIT